MGIISAMDGHLFVSKPCITNLGESEKVNLSLLEGLVKKDMTVGQECRQGNRCFPIWGIQWYPMSKNQLHEHLPMLQFLTIKV